MRNLTDKDSEGTTFGQDAADKVGLHGKAAAQANAITSVTTTAATTSTPAGFSTTTQADAIVTSVNAILVALRAKGIIAE